MEIKDRVIYEFFELLLFGEPLLSKHGVYTRVKSKGKNKLYKVANPLVKEYKALSDKKKSEFKNKSKWK